MNVVPSFECVDEQSVQVRRWGRVAGCTLRPGDRLLVQACPAGGLVVLVPRGFGRPMLGRQTRRGLRAEPGDVPASAARWTVLGGVRAVERSLERGGPEAGGWVVAVRLVPVPGREPRLAAAQAALPAGRCSASEVEALLLRALLAPDRWGVEVAVGMAQTAAEAGTLAAEAQPGTVRFALVESEVEPTGASTGGVLIEGPWQPREERPRWAGRGEGQRPAVMQVPLFADSRSA